MRKFRFGQMIGFSKSLFLLEKRVLTDGPKVKVRDL